MKSNIETGLDQEKVQVKSPTHSLASSSCGSYSVHDTENGKKTSTNNTPSSAAGMVSEQNLGKKAELGIASIWT